MINLKYQKIRARVHFEVFMIDVISTDSAAWSASFHAIEAPAGKKALFSLMLLVDQTVVINHRVIWVIW